MKAPKLRALLFACAASLLAAPAQAAEYVSTVIASGLNNPRGLAFGADGALYVAESGFVQTGGPTVTLSRGPASHIFHVSNTGSISRIFEGTQSRIITGLPSIGSLTVAETTGPQDIAFGADGTGYFVVGFVTDPAARAGLGPQGNLFGQVFTFSGATVTPLSDVAALEASNPARRELNSNPYHLAALPGGLLVTDAGSNTLVRVGSDGTASNLATFLARNVVPAFLTDAVPTGIAVGPDGNYYVAELTGIPFAQGSAQIYRVTPEGGVSVAFTGFTNIGDIAFGPDGALYVLQVDSNGLTTPPAGGSLLRVGMDGSRQTIFSQGLITPTGLEIGRDGAFYITNFSAAERVGQVLRVAAVPEPGTWAMMLIGFGAVGAAIRRQRKRELATA